MHCHDERFLNLCINDCPLTHCLPVKEKLDHFDTFWNGFVDSHNKYMEVTNTEESTRISEQFATLSQKRINFSTVVVEFICKAAADLNDRVMQDLQKTSPAFWKSKGSCTRSSRLSKGSSQVQARRAEAVKAKLALEFAEQEKQRKIEAEKKYWH